MDLFGYLTAYIVRACKSLFERPAKLERNHMTPFITLHVSLNPTDEELRKHREVLALVRTLSNATDKTRNDPVHVDESATLVPLPPAPPAPPATTVVAPPAPATPPAAVVTDSTGLPWDERIHSGSKATNKDGTWKKRKGVQESEVAKITAQIRATLPAVVAAPPAPALPEPAAVFQQAVPPPAPSAAPPPPAPVGTPTFVSILQKVSGRVAGGTLTQAKVADLCKQLGIVDGVGNGSLPLVAQRPDMFAALDALIDATV